MSSEVEICNMGLGYVGVAREIDALDEGSTESDQCQRYYTQTRDATLRDFAWPFANKVQALALVAEDPNDDWSFAYRYPTDCLKALRLVTGDRVATAPPPFEIGHDDAGKLIYTDQAEAVLKFTRRIEDPELFDPAFVECLAWRMGSKLAIPLSRSEKERDYAFKRYQHELSVARALAANEGQLDSAPEAESIRERG